MTLNSGFERYEGLAYFGYEPEGEGYEAVVVVGESFIEIRNTFDQTLSIWAPTAYSCNNEPIPMRAYFLDQEWLAPRDEELQGVLDRYMETSASVAQTPQKKPKSPWRFLAYILAFILLIIIGYFAINLLTSRLLNSAIRSELDAAITAPYLINTKICNKDQEEIARRTITDAISQPSFVILQSLGTDYARLPSGTLAIDAEFAKKLGSEQALISLLQLADIKNISADAGTNLIQNLSIASKIRFLAYAEIADNNLRTAWQAFMTSDKFDVGLLARTKTLMGDYQKLATLMPNWREQEYPNNPVNITLMDQDWLALITLCPVE